ncbi:dehydrodolichyl diphosphate synthase complex subunit DHDDS-like [Uloborus diversus]|uniref:dehydrodolichyl diphosphate synthase complex subunit DHDDS-like n=1 Tax=Uloborus diversus TaxID=327109 RepID=UPI0024090557|nr:dehydrodolichyl diphosphate synthase complex subunit DHDDS-like [Uloborus diversus]
MAWYRESKRTWLEKLCIDVLKCGSIPKHVAFIMDGNRRYATKNGMEKLQGHALGFEKLSETLEWCLDLGITEVTVYTFSIENFKRPKEEVDCLMNLAREKFQDLLQEKEKLDKYGVCIRIFGDITLLPEDIQMLIADVVLYTYNNSKTYLNVCFAYTSREEITNATKEIAQEVVAGNLFPCDITENIFNRSLYSCKSSNPDIVVRTSGEVRLSDFLLWQSSYSVLYFFQVLWPEFKIWHLFLAVLFYQHHSKTLKVIKERHYQQMTQLEEKEDTVSAIQEHQKMHENPLQHKFPLDVLEIRGQMEIRRKNYLNQLDSERYRRLICIKNGQTKQNSPPVS